MAAEHASERGEDRPIGRFEARSRHLTMQDGELMAQDEDLGVLGTIGAAAQHQQADHETDKTVEVGHAAILTALRSHRSSERETPGHRIRMSFRPVVCQNLGFSCRAAVFVDEAAELVAATNS